MGFCRQVGSPNLEGPTFSESRAETHGKVDSGSAKLLRLLGRSQERYQECRPLGFCRQVGSPNLEGLTFFESRAETHRQGGFWLNEVAEAPG